VVVTDKAYAMESYNWTESATVVNDEFLEVGTDDYLRGVYTDIIKRILTINQDVGAANIQGGNRDKRFEANNNWQAMTMKNRL
jgi:hypothetical protein